MKKITTGFEIVDSAGDEKRCICSEGSADGWYTEACGHQCGCKGPSSDADNDAANYQIASAYPGEGEG